MQHGENPCDVLLDGLDAGMVVQLIGGELEAKVEFLLLGLGQRLDQLVCLSFRGFRKGS